MEENNVPILQPENIIVLEDNHADLHDEDVILDENTIILASGDTYSLIDMHALRTAVKKSGLSFEDIANKMDISASSIYKFFAKKSKSPSFYNTVMIFKAIGASVDTLCGIIPTQDNASASANNDLVKQIGCLEKMIEKQNQMILELTREVQRISANIRDDY